MPKTKKKMNSDFNKFWVLAAHSALVQVVGKPISFRTQHQCKVDHKTVGDYIGCLAQVSLSIKIPYF